MRVDKFKTFRKMMNFMVLLGATFPKVRRYFWRRAAVTRPMQCPSRLRRRTSGPLSDLSHGLGEGDGQWFKANGQEGQGRHGEVYFHQRGHGQGHKEEGARAFGERFLSLALTK